jgi:hypothetical protein
MARIFCDLAKRVPEPFSGSTLKGASTKKAPRGEGGA